MVEEAVAKLAMGVVDQMSDQWSDWKLLDGQGFQALQHRVSELDARDPTITAAEVQEFWQPHQGAKPKCRGNE